MRDPKTICVQFSGPMILAMLADRKTQTRRLGTSPLRHLLPGDKIVVREHWMTMAAFDEIAPSDLPEHPVLYLADKSRINVELAEAFDHWGKHRQAMHMLAADSRMTLTVTEIRIQRLQDISKADAVAEGIDWETADPPFYYVPGIDTSIVAEGFETGPGGEVRCYSKLWNMLHTEPTEQWLANPIVVAISFSVERISR